MVREEGLIPRMFALDALRHPCECFVFTARPETITQRSLQLQKDECVCSGNVSFMVMSKPQGELTPLLVSFPPSAPPPVITNSPYD